MFHDRIFFYIAIYLQLVPIQTILIHQTKSCLVALLTFEVLEIILTELFKVFFCYNNNISIIKSAHLKQRKEWKGGGNLLWNCKNTSGQIRKWWFSTLIFKSNYISPAKHKMIILISFYLRKNLCVCFYFLNIIGCKQILIACCICDVKRYKNLCFKCKWFWNLVNIRKYQEQTLIKHI